MPVTTYDAQEGNLYLVLGAAIWMLDYIKTNEKIQEAKKIPKKLMSTQFEGGGTAFGKIRLLVSAFSVPFYG